MLPDMSGLEVLEKLKNAPETAKIPILIFSNIVDKAGIEKALAGGALMYLIKSNTPPNKLVDIVTNELKL